MESRKLLKSGEFLVSSTEAADVFIPEEFSEEQKMIAQTCSDFLETEVMPKMNDLETSRQGTDEVNPQKVGRAGYAGHLDP